MSVKAGRCWDLYGVRGLNEAICVARSRRCSVAVAFNDGIQFVSCLRDWEKMKRVAAV